MNQTLKLGDTEVDSRSLFEVCRRYGVKELSIFGSSVRGEMRAESDIDIMVEFEPGVRIGLIRFESLTEELESGKPSNRLDSPVYRQARSARPRPGNRHQTDAEHPAKSRPRPPMTR